MKEKSYWLLYLEVILLVILIALPTALYFKEKINKGRLPDTNTFEYECYAEREGIYVHGFSHNISNMICCCNKLYTCICWDELN